MGDEVVVSCEKSEAEASDVKKNPSAGGDEKEADRTTKVTTSVSNGDSKDVAKADRNGLERSPPTPSTSNSSSSSSSSTSLKAGHRHHYNHLHHNHLLKKFSPAEKRFKFEPNEDYLDQLIAMGISINGAKKALFYTGNRSVALATNWIFDHPQLDLDTPLEVEIKRMAEEDFDDDDEDVEEEEIEDDEEEDEDEDEEEMRKAARLHGHVCSHHHNKSSSHDEPIYVGDTDTESDSEDDFDEDDIPDFKMVFVVNCSLDMGPGKTAAQVGHAALGLHRIMESQHQRDQKLGLSEFGLWQDFGEKMVVLKGESTQHLQDLQLMADDLELPNFIVKDVGITQVASGSPTVFAVFGEDEEVNKISGRLKLL